MDERTVTVPPGHADRSSTVGIRAGTRIRQYELIRELGRGGMGKVYLARDTKLARRVALKFVTAGSVRSTERFLAEARATARCTHENIVVIHEVDAHDGTPYMVLEYLEGVTLRELSADNAQSPGRAVELVLPIVRALVRAHEFDIVHRDLKPENVLVTASGTIKVLDFGIAKLTGESDAPAVGAEAAAVSVITERGVMVGTVPYMAPEQIAGEAIDHRVDLWAVGIMLFELVTGRHPLAPVTLGKLVVTLSELDRPMPELPMPDVPEGLRRVVARCLSKRKTDRIASAAELREELEKLLPGRTDIKLSPDDSPYPGLSSFQEGDADRFFGRDQDTRRVATRLREQPLVGIIGASGIGKSSLVRAGLLPALKASGEAWTVRTIRPGRSPVASLARLLAEDARDTDRLMTEPGALGANLRARSDGAKLLLFVDQFEELYTLCSDEAQRRAFTAALSGVADDPNGPLRVVVTMRSDFLDRVGEDARFLDDLVRGLIFVQPLGTDALREALVRPLEHVGYAFESQEIVDDMVGALVNAPGALPLLQFAASRLWDTRDRQRKRLTRGSHDEMGGIAGALAAHADLVLSGLAPAAQRLTRTLFLHLVTPDRTRAVVDRDELRGLAAEPTRIDTIVDQLVQARMLVVQHQPDTDCTTVELVHESLIHAWPTLARWLDEDHEDAAYLAQLRTAARQWDQKGRAPGLLWRGEPEREASQFRARYTGELGARERAFLDAVFQLAGRSRRVRRSIVVGSIALLAAIAVGSAVALITIRHAERDAQDQAQHARDEANRAQEEAERARSAEHQVKTQLDQIKAEQDARAKAEQDAKTMGSEAKMSKGQLEIALVKEQQARQVAEQESQRAHEAELRAQLLAATEKKLREEAAARYEQERAHAQELEERAKQITTTLKK